MGITFICNLFVLKKILTRLGKEKALPPNGSRANMWMHYYFNSTLYREAFAAGAGTTGIGVIEVKPFAIQPF
jgi:hypothetical protein